MDGSLGGAVAVKTGGILAGGGTINGSVQVTDGVLAAGGGSAGTLAISGDLSLTSASTLSLRLGQAGVVGGSLNDLVTVGGNLTLAGSLDVSASPGGVFGPGVYRLISYSGSLTDNGLAIGVLPTGSQALLQTAVAGQVNLINYTGLPVSFWDGDGAGRTNDGIVEGGAGVWTAGGTNWTTANGSANAALDPTALAVFGGTPGAVSVSGPVSAAGLQFAVDGYHLSGGQITLTGGGASTVRVGDGTAAGAGYAATIDNVLAGATTLSKSDLGTLILTSANTFSGGATVAGGTLQLGNGGTTGSILGDVSDNGTLAFDRSDAVTFSGAITGTGGVRQMGAGTTVLTGANSYIGGTTISGGVLQVGAGGASGALGGGDVANNGKLVFDLSGNAAVVGAISGSGVVAQNGSGVLTLSGLNSYAGGTNVNSGTLDVKTSTALGTGALGLATGATLILDGNGLTFANAATLGGTGDPTITVSAGNANSWAGVISGAAALTVNGGGALTLAGQNTYTGPTTVSGTGTALIVNGSIAGSAVTLGAGTRLSGTGMVGAVAVGQGATFAPGAGAAGDSQTVAGNLAFATGSIFSVALNPATASLAKVTGTAALTGGTVQAVYAPGSYLSNRYTVLQATGGLGGTTFAGLGATNLPGGFEEALSYDANNVYLNLTAVLNGGVQTGMAANPQNVSNALNDYFNGGGALPGSFVPIFALTGAPLSEALSSLSGEAATGASQAGFKTSDQFMQVLLDPYAPGRVKGQACPSSQGVDCPDQPAVWASVMGGYGRLGGSNSTGSHDLASDTYGLAAGADFRLGANSVVGAAVATGQTNWDLSGGVGSGGGDVFQAGLYGAQDMGLVRMTAAFAYSNFALSTGRMAAGAVLSAKYHADDFAGRLEADYRLPGQGLAPYAVVQTQRFNLPAYAETDPSNSGYGLTYAARGFTDTRAEVGVKLDEPVMTTDGSRLNVRLQLAYAHDWVSDPALAAAFSKLPGSTFAVAGAAPIKDAALISTGLEWRDPRGWTISDRIDGEFGSRGQSFGGSLAFRYVW